MPIAAMRDYSPAVCVCGNHAFARTTKAGVVLVDPQDRGVLERPWLMNEKGYAERPRDGKMHRLIANASVGVLVDHKNHDKLDNRRDNLRCCNDVESLRNRGKLKPGGKCASPYKGVARNGSGWAARINLDGRRAYLGTFRTEVAAAEAYDVAAKKHFGAFAKLNFEGAR